MLYTHLLGFCFDRSFGKAAMASPPHQVSGTQSKRLATEHDINASLKGKRAEVRSIEASSRGISSLNTVWVVPRPKVTFEFRSGTRRRFVSTPPDRCAPDGRERRFTETSRSDERDAGILPCSLLPTTNRSLAIRVSFRQLAPAGPRAVAPEGVLPASLEWQSLTSHSTCP
jgi:hypothetical protein